jgi:transcriptional regulator with XRE-family HTH domain
MVKKFLIQIKTRRLTLGLKQKDIYGLVGISRQQYQRLESKGNPRLKTLQLVAKGLDSELLLVPKDKLKAVNLLITELDAAPKTTKKSPDPAQLSFIDDLF